ncbi:hypothetical protein PV11_09150 [Exophiala sideris]|uniref:Uncharacterized protein n=1 Tax=Exophiala sideris TaxID=1016849 RepID=A0A0D1VMX6_9EURO|nr:hypothetical protein PV11_09150 [Exophiala sideris]
MYYLPSVRRWFVFVLTALSLLVCTRLLQHQQPSASSFLQAALRSYTQKDTQFTLINITHLPDKDRPFLEKHLTRPIPIAHPLIASFQKNSTATFNSITNHIRLPNILYNITLTGPGSTHDPAARFFNPAIIPLPHWSSSSPGAPKYVLVSRLVTAGFHQESHICLADICTPESKFDTRECTPDDISLLGPRGGLRCTSAPIKINIPPTPAEKCDGAWTAFPDIPGFHDPRIFWSGKGEPLILVNSASRYGCVGLWIVDLRTLFPGLDTLLGRGRPLTGQLGAGALMSYPHLTEITRNPRSSRASVEKNWVLWFPSRNEAYVHYDMLGHGHHLNSTAKSMNGTSTGRRGGRTFAKLTGNGFTTTNLTHPDESLCFGAGLGEDTDTADHGNTGHWHQGSNALRLILCTRAQARSGACDEDNAVEDGRSVHFAIMHRKFSNEMDLPLRYERYVVVWDGRPPFQVLAVSRWPVLMRNERAKPWTVAENWLQDNTGWNGTGMGNMLAKRMKAGRGHDWHDTGDFRSDASFTYTPSLAWAWKPHSAGIGDEDEEDDDVETMSRLGVGYLGDEVLMGIGLDDVRQAFARVKVDDLLQCMRLCPGVEIADEGR